jgi:hypothetical protein
MRNLVIGIVIGIGLGIAVIDLDARQRDAWTYGVGTWSCGKWRDLRTSRAAGARSNAVEIEYLAAEQWVLGFVTGIAWDPNEAMETDRIDIQALWAALDSALQGSARVASPSHRRRVLSVIDPSRVERSNSPSLNRHRKGMAVTEAVHAAGDDGHRRPRVSGACLRRRDRQVSQVSGAARATYVMEPHRTGVGGGAVQDQHRGRAGAARAAPCDVIR